MFKVIYRSNIQDGNVDDQRKEVLIEAANETMAISEARRQYADIHYVVSVHAV